MRRTVSASTDIVPRRKQIAPPDGGYSRGRFGRQPEPGRIEARKAAIQAQVPGESVDRAYVEPGPVTRVKGGGTEPGDKPCRHVAAFSPSDRSGVFALCLGLQAVAQAVAQDQTPKDFVTSIYHSYQGKGAKGIPLNSPMLRRLLTPALMKLIDDDGKRAAQAPAAGTRRRCLRRRAGMGGQGVRRRRPGRRHRQGDRQGHIQQFQSRFRP